MEMYIWNAIIVLSKILFYVGFACIAGYTFWGGSYSGNTMKTEDKRSFSQITFMTALIAFIANTVWFFANTGAIAEEGIGGVLDLDMIIIMWDSSIGDTAIWRSIGLIGAIMLVVFSSPMTVRNRSLNVLQLLLVICLLVFSYSYTLVGHVSEMGVFEKGLLMVHVIVMAWWFGALYPLKKACDMLELEKLYQIMERFGKQASVMVSLLLIAGLLLVIQLVGGIEALLTSNYGQTILVKLLLVTSILTIAATHKLKLVPQLKSNDGRKALSKSISIEMFVAIAILSVTAVLTSIVGPVN
ncbi:CopD family protein [Paraglaciecola aquimarina]|jgi:putative copper resistance protein D|uniref:Copper resistance protein D n=3 Tax=Alteromonadaceae TaxID=72275 RepID=W7Q8F4_9ALTE|nr:MULTISPECIES: CopD family protein [Alteromonadaceae]EWH08291.1 copper export protein [Catenovulum agarivorans DS-2]MCF2948821.1 CopD family protein [Paraglaciecola sp. G1-23]MDN4504089.1 CopD family protein [Alteromonadaceae bacterium BrNp21-10]